MKKIRAFLAAMMMLAAMPFPTLTGAAEDSYDGYYVIRNVNSGLYLNVTEGKTADGTNVQQWSTDAAHAYDTWHLQADADGYYAVYSMLGDKKLALTVSDGNVCISAANGADAQLFRLAGNADGSFRILTKSDEQAVEIVNAETTAGANVQVWEQNGINCQDWELVPVTWGTANQETKSQLIGEEFTPGDLNNDGVVNVIDAALARKLVLGQKGTQQQMYAANVDGEEGIFVSDLVRIQKFLHTGKGDFIAENVPTERIYAGIDADYTEGVSETTNAGFTQDAYLNLDNKAGVTAAWNVSVPAAGVYAVKVHYANGGTTDRKVSVYLNNQISYWTLQGKMTGDWTVWEEETIYLPLQTGVNTLTFVSETADGASNIDYVSVSSTTEKLSPSTPIPPIKGTAEAVGGAHNVKGVGYQMEYLSRGLSAANTGTGMMLTWRILATDADQTNFKLYKNGKLLAEVPAGEASCYYDEGGTPADVYTIDTYVGKKMIEQESPAVVYATKNSGQSGAYFDIATKKPDDLTMPDGTTCSYTENDCSVGDIDGDGVYELFVKWDPSNSQDNSKDGYTGNVYIDCYRLDGTLVWRIDLGKNIRAGAHYAQYMVYDFDGDGKCELICKTADGTVDGKGSVIGDGTKDYRSGAGRILTGPEYITLFDGATGAALDTQDYDPGRGNVSDWGDSYGNRVDRFTACVAYLDGQNASAIFGRGYYTRLVVAAWDVVDKKLSKRWVFDTGYDKSAAGYGDGNHQEMAADVDGDGKQEVVCGSAVIDDNGKLLYTTSNAHGDALHIGDFDPANPGLEIFQCLEDEVHPNGKKINFGVELRDAATGKVLFRETAGGDTGRCIADNFVAGNDGAELIGSHNSVMYSATGDHAQVGTWADITKWGQNSVVYWTDVLERAALDRTMVDQHGKGRVFSGDGVAYNNYTKSNACLTCDLTGDWREEMIFRKSDGGLRVFTTTYATTYPVYSLMHNPQYRVQVAAQNNGYNQPPHTDYFLGTGYDLPALPTVFDYTAE